MISFLTVYIVACLFIYIMCDIKIAMVFMYIENLGNERLVLAKSDALKFGLLLLVPFINLIIFYKVQVITLDGAYEMLDEMGYVIERK